MPQFVSSSDILSNLNGNLPRLIDVYTFVDSSKTFDVDAALTTATGQISSGGKAFCSSCVVNALDAGYSINKSSLTTPDLLGVDPQLQKVGTYDTINQRSMLPSGGSSSAQGTNGMGSSSTNQSGSQTGMQSLGQMSDFGSNTQQSSSYTDDIGSDGGDSGD